jgi:hypothetical protein
MTRPDRTQLNIRSRFARARAASIARTTGMSVTQVVEEALRAYHPATSPSGVGRLVRQGRILVMPAQGEVISAEETEELLDQVRGGSR